MAGGQPGGPRGDPLDRLRGAGGASRSSRCPEINGLLVWPAPLRSQGVGTALVHTAERLARERGIGVLGLGVGDDNPRAAALYARLGCLPTVAYVDRWVHLTADGVRQERADPCVFLVKAL
ncbi:GNAT family N-acetyltransferase [Streptomyces sp. NPDC013187]|uniref:GNAT family N-acetyltransferase n=1 Tax=Streptomyces sp. NPDC013187 TaxID=3364865 RepID=UPI003677EE6D